MVRWVSDSISRYFFKPDLITLATEPFCLSHSASAAAMLPALSNEVIFLTKVSTLPVPDALLITIALSIENTITINTNDMITGTRNPPLCTVPKTSRTFVRVAQHLRRRRWLESPQDKALKINQPPTSETDRNSRAVQMRLMLQSLLFYRYSWFCWFWLRHYF